MTTETKLPKESKGGTFSSADIPLIKNALAAYVREIGPDHEDVSKIASLMHRLGRIA